MACVLCGSEEDLTDEDVIPTGLLNAFRVERRSTTFSVAEEGGDSRPVRRLGKFQVTLDDGLCRKCNGDRLGGLEQLVQPILVPMAVRGEHVTVGLASQRLLAVWAIKTVYLLELASRQRYPGTRLIEGYLPSASELGWLLAELERGPVKSIKPPPRSFVWLAAWDCRSAIDRATVVHYATSTAPVRPPTGGEVVGQFTTLAVGFAVFQVFTVDFVEAAARNAEVWNTHPPGSIAAQVQLIWPHRMYAGDVTWPPPSFPHSDFDRIANWDGKLRRGA